MPTILRVDGYEIVIYLDDHPPPHVHVFAHGCEAIVYLNCPRSRELKAILKVVGNHRERLCAMWKEIHGDF
jgi:hypothetical protein